MNFGERIKQLRLEKDMRQEDLAKIINVHRATIGKYENNERFPDLEILEALADYFKVTVDYLLGRSDIRNPYDKDNIKSCNEDECFTLDELEKFLKYKRNQTTEKN